MRDSLTFLAVVAVACVAALPCPDALYEIQHRSWLQPYVQATNPAVSEQFGVAPNAGVVSIAQWVSLTPQQGKGSQSTMLSVAHGIPGFAPYGDSYRLFWDDKNSRMTFELINNATANLPADGSNSTDALQAYSVLTTLYGSGVIEVNSNQYRLVSITLNAVTGTVSIAVDGVFLIMASVPALQMFGVSLGANSTITLNADMDGSNVLIGQTADVIVTRGQAFSAADLQYLTQFRYPLNTTADGNCTAMATSPSIDPSCPQGSIAVYFFTTEGWSFPGSQVIDNWGGFASWNIGASELSLATRSVTSGLQILISPSWTPAQMAQLSCGAAQSATIPFSSGLVQRVTLVFDWGTTAGPILTDNFIVSDNDGNVMIASFNGASIAQTKSFTFTYQVSTMKLNFTVSSVSFTTYCLSNVVALSVGPVIADPASAYSGVSTAISFYAGLQVSDSVAFVTFGQPCSTVMAKDVLSPVVSFPVADRNFTTFLQVVLPTEMPSGAYSMCIFPGGILGAEAYVSSFCDPNDYSSTFLCEFDVAYLPDGAIPLPRDWVHSLLHLGADYFDSLAHGLFNVDYFATIGGQSSMQPQIGDMFNTSLGVYVWTPLQSPSGLFAQPNPASPLAFESVQYFSMALYSGVAQTIALSVKFANGVMIFIDGENVFQEYLGSEDLPASDVTIYHSDPIVLEVGWHQVNVKLWAPPASTTSVFALRFDQAQQLSWSFEMPAGSGANGSYAEICANADTSVSCVASNPDLNHDECVALGCCYYNVTTAGNPHCTAPGGGLVPYRTDARCGVGFPAANLNVSQCNPRSSTDSTCCSAWNWCGSGPLYCDCPTCTDYSYLVQPRCSYSIWGTKARCLGSTFTDAGYVSYGTCATACDADSTCVAFSLTGPSYGQCRLYTNCDQTVVSATVAVTYHKFCGTAATPCSLVPQTGMRCTDTMSNIVSVGATSMSDCMALCMVATRCTGVQYNSNTSVCYFLQRTCTSPLVPASGNSVAYFHCPGDAVAPPAPMAHPPNTTTFIPVGCFSDPTATLLADPNAPWEANGQLYYSSNYNNFSASLMTVEYCRSYCEPLGARYFAISNGYVCTCGVRYDAVATADSDCSTPCPANSSEKCGGPTAANLFMIQLTQGPCIDGYWYFNNNCFKYVSDPTMSSWLSWADARAACAADGGALSSIHSSADSQFLLSVPFSTNPSMTRITWAGATQSSWGFNYEWVDGSDLDFSDWRAGEPNSGGGTGINEGCLSVFSNHATPYKGSWNDADCTTAYPYLCKINLNHSLAYPRLYLAQSEAANLCVYSFYIPQLTQDLTAFFSFDNSLFDRSGNLYAFSVMNSGGLVATRANFTNGVRRSALSLSGGSYLLAQSNWDVTKDFLTISVWVRPTVAPTSGQIIVSKSFQDDAANESMPQFCWAIAYDATGSNVCFYVGYTHVCTPSSALNNWWFHVAGTFDGRGLYLYINGTMVASAAVPPSANSSYAPLLRSAHPVAVGYRSSTPWDATRVFSGNLDELRIYQATLEPTQVLYLAACTPQNSQFSLISVYEGSSPKILLEGGGFSADQDVVLSDGYCMVGATSNYAPTPLVVGNDPSTAAWFPNPDEMYPPFSNDTWSTYYLQTYYICYTNPADKFFIGGSTNLQLAVVSVNTIGGAYDAFNASINELPLTVAITGTNLQNGHVLVTASDPGCNQIVQMATLWGASYNGSSASITISSSQVNEGINYFCWGSSANAAASSSTLHPTGISLFVYTPGAQITRLAAVDGTTQIDASVIRQGMYSSPNNYFSPCSTLNFMGDSFFMTVTMGSFVDYYFPLEGNTVCDTLLGQNFFTMWMQEPYTYSSVSPLDPAFTGITMTVPFNWNFGQIGGSPSGFVSDGRNQISSWGDRYNSDHTGGCCFSKPGQESEWFQAYTIVVASVNKTNRYLAVPLVPSVAVIGEPIVFQAQVLDTFGSIAQQSVSFLVTFQAVSGGVITQWTISNTSSAQLDFSTTLSTNMSIYSSFVINVTVLNVPDVQNGNSRTMVVPIIVSTPPAGFTSIDPTKYIPTYLHFGSVSTGVPVEYYYLGMYTDWFYEYGGEPNYQPRLNEVATASDDSFFSFSQPTNVTATWTSVSAPNGIFAGTVAADTIQFFALAIYSPVSQSIQVQYSINTAVRCYLDGVHFIAEFSGVNNSMTDFTPITEGYHQLFCKIYSNEAGTSLLALKVVGAALSWGLNLPLGLPTGTTLLMVNQTINELLHLGPASAFISGYFYTDYVSENTVMPNAGDVSYGLTWTDVQSATGSWIIDASNVTGIASTAISYFAFGLYSLSDSYVTFQVPATDVGEVFLDGTEAYYFWKGSGSVETFEVYLSAGWHQVLIKLGVYVSSQSEAFSITPTSIDGIVAFAVQTLSKLPPSAYPFAGTVTSLMQLYSSDFTVDSTSFDKIPYDPQGPSFYVNYSDVSLDGIVTSSDNVTVDILGSGKLSSFGWFAQDSTTGSFGSAGMGGSFSSYFALGLYSTVDMSAATFTVSFQQGYAFWLDGELISFSDLFIPGGRTKSFALKQGWHQVIVKLKAASDFHLTPIPNTTTWAMASTICHKANYMQMCSQSAYCPYGVPRPQYFPENVKGNDYVPARDESNTWVQVSKNGDTTPCTTNYDPTWGTSNSPVEGRYEMGCCGALDKPFVSFSFTPDPTTSGELGWSYEVPQEFVSSPVITVENQKSSLQTVSITCANSKAKIYYTEDYTTPTTSSTLYTEPFDVTTSELVTAVCYLNPKSQSSYSFDYIYIPSDPYLTRSACVADAKCFADVYGVEQGSLITFVLHDTPNISSYLSLSFASSVPTSASFQGVVRVTNNNSLIIPALAQGQYTPIVYDEIGDGTFLQSDILFQQLSITPSAVVAVNGVVFSLGGGGVAYGDTVLFLDPLFGSSTLDSSQCSNEACGRAFTNSPSAIQYYAGSSVQVDLLGYSGRLSCLCFAATGEADYSQAPADILNRIAAPVAISVSVVPPAHTTDTYGLVSPSVVLDAETLSFTYGVFTNFDTGSYNVQFAPVSGTSSSLNGTLVPTCEVSSVNKTTVQCSIFARAGVSGKWNVSLEQNGEVLATLPGTVTIVTVVPPKPTINLASGTCISRSSACVSGAVVTFIGNSFDPVNIDNNNIFFDPATISCTTVSVTISAIVCRLFVPPDAAGQFAVWISLTVSADYSYTYSTGQSLTLGQGDTPGWSGNAATNTPGYSGNSPAGSSNTAGVVAGVFGGALAVIVVVVLIVNRRYSLVPKAKQSEEMDAIEQQLNDDARPREAGLEVHVPPIPHVEQHGSVNNV